MCTIGAVFDQEEDRTLVFKQCDLRERVRFHAPRVQQGSGGLRMVLMTRGPGRRPWAGFNSAGVVVVGADTYLDLDPEVNPPWSPPDDVNLDDVYPATLAHCESADEAVEYLLGLYEDLRVPDMALVADRGRALLVESSPWHGVSVRVAEPEDGCLVGTNHYNVLPGGVSAEDNPSTHLRLARATDLLSDSPDAAGVMALLADQDEGETERSLCRVAEEPGEFFTQASLVVSLDDGGVDALYVLNGNARTRPFTHRPDVFRRARLR